MGKIHPVKYLVRLSGNPRTIPNEPTWNARRRRGGKWSANFRYSALGLILLLCSYGYCGDKYQPISLSAAPLDQPQSHYFDYPEGPLNPVVHLLKEKRKYQLFKVEFDSRNGEKVVMYHYKERRHKKPAAAIVLLPIYDGGYLWERFLAHYLAKHGFAVLRFERTRELLEPEEGLGYVRKAMKDTIVDIRQGMDWLIEQPEIDSQRIGIMGTSFGAVLAGLVTGIDARIKAAVFFLGGGDIGLLFSKSKEDVLVRFRERIMTLNGYTLEEFRRAFSQTMREVDPLTYAPRLSPAKILMISALWDQVVIRECTEKLWRALGRPEQITLWAGHYTAPFYVLYIRSRILKHFKDALGNRP